MDDGLFHESERERDSHVPFSALTPRRACMHDGTSEQAGPWHSDHDKRRRFGDFSVSAFALVLSA